MLFSEEMTVLSERFREVTVTLAAPVKLPRDLPSAWLVPETVDCVVRLYTANTGARRANTRWRTCSLGARCGVGGDAAEVDLPGDCEDGTNTEPAAQTTACDGRPEA